MWSGRGDANGRFTIPNVPDGNYTLTWWDEPQNYILDLQQVTVAGGEVVDLGIVPLTGWWTYYDGYVFNDANRNGIMDWADADGDACPDPGEGELGVPNYTLTMRRRDNTLMDRGSRVVGTDACGHYVFESAYPMTQWLVMEAYSDLYYTTGITYQADNQPAPTTVLGAGVDVSTLPIIGLSGRMDWGVHAYDARGTNGIDPQNGGIVGTVSYDTTRNELDPRFAAVEDWQPGVSGLLVELSEPVSCLDDNGDPVPPCDPTESYRLGADGSYMSGPVINTYITETWEQPGANGNANGDGDCVPRDADGDRAPVRPRRPADHQLAHRLPRGAADGRAVPAGLLVRRRQLRLRRRVLRAERPRRHRPGEPGLPRSERRPRSTSTRCRGPATTSCGSCRRPTRSTAVRPTSSRGRRTSTSATATSSCRRCRRPACAGALHQVDVAGMGADDYPALVGNDINGVPTGVTVPASTPTDSPTLVDIGGSPYEGLAKPLCDTKLVPLANGRSIVPTFNVFTDVPLPGRFWGLLVDDLNFSSDPTQINYGEKSGIRFAPVGIYDYTDRLVYTVESDNSGLFDVLMPSTNRINCPTPSGVCGNLYRFVGNDPGTPGQLNPNYRPEFRTIAAEFEAIPGNLIPADLAPTQVGRDGAAPRRSGDTGAVRPTGERAAADGRRPPLRARLRPGHDPGAGFRGDRRTGGARRRRPPDDVVERPHDRRQRPGHGARGPAPADGHLGQRRDDRQRPHVPRAARRGRGAVPDHRSARQLQPCQPARRRSDSAEAGTSPPAIESTRAPQQPTSAR